jgi:hypothetical protein
MMACKILYFPIFEAYFLKHILPTLARQKGGTGGNGGDNIINRKRRTAQIK